MKKRAKEGIKIFLIDKIISKSIALITLIILVNIFYFVFYTFKIDIHDGIADDSFNNVTLKKEDLLNTVDQLAATNKISSEEAKKIQNEIRKLNNSDLSAITEKAKQHLQNNTELSRLANKYAKDQIEKENKVDKNNSNSSDNNDNSTVEAVEKFLKKSRSPASTTLTTTKNKNNTYLKNYAESNNGQNIQDIEKIKEMEIQLQQTQKEIDKIMAE
ncbi:MAG: hypothetical protein HQK51_01655 [Oligoflexia bacterium]|nr:hypothetical protein [Oligoflexia bacterium]